ncbi:MAG: MgtC/SapB family protein [Alphaproteobacteria bacterium]|nr:MgtC/SapB family protein [Alphaproteobacteria bacterium]
MIDLEIAIKLFMSLLLGAVIGIEREWHKRIADIRTNVLVAIGATAFIVFADLFPRDDSPTRIASQIVSGIGFLAGGVIIRNGLNVTGLNTAATIWCSAAVGVFCGGGYYIGAVILTLFVIMTNYGLRHFLNALSPRILPHIPREKIYHIEIICKKSQDLQMRSTLTKVLQEKKFELKKLDTISLKNELVTLIAIVGSQDYKEDGYQEVVSLLSLEDGVKAISWTVAKEINH